MVETSSMERTSAPRRKSCEACRSAKRRCDFAFPACLRCARRNIPCVYPERQVPYMQGCDPLSVPYEGTLSNEEAVALDSTLQGMMDDYFQTLPSLDPSTLDALDVQQYKTDAAEGVPYDSSTQDVLPQIYELALPRTRSLRPLSAVIADHLQFGMDMLKEAPKMMVVQNRTPWCHPQVYKSGMPRSMQDAYACCALYMAKNEVNAPVILASFDSRIQDLLASSDPTTPLEALAHTHSLILYQIIRLFDGDIRARASAESLFSAMERSAVSLLNHIHFPDIMFADSALSTARGHAMESWETWVFQESARRTVLLTFYFLQIYRIIQGESNLECDGKLGLIHSWYSSAHLWHATSAFDFAVAWAERDHFVVRNADFTSLLCRAHADDVDLFGRMILVAILGLDRARAWFHSRGAVL